MGAWGYNNLENDCAQDLLAVICDDHFGRIIATLKSDIGHEYDEYEHDELFVLIEFVIAMSERGMVNSSPNVDELQPLFAPFLDRWAEYHRKAGHEPSEGRARVIKESFAKLAEIAEGASEGSFAHRLNLISEAMSKPKTDET